MRQNDTSASSEENEKAKRAYRALKTISLRRSDLDEYKNFEARVKERAEKKYSYSLKTGKEYEVRSTVSHRQRLLRWSVLSEWQDRESETREFHRPP